MNKVTIQEALDMPTKTLIPSIGGTLKAVFNPEQGRGYDKDIQVQNLILTDGTFEIRVVLVDPALFIDPNTSKGKDITFSCSPTNGGPNNGQLVGCAKQVDSGKSTYHKVRCTGKCVVTMGGGGEIGSSVSSKSGKVSTRPTQPPLPFNFYVQDYLSCIEEVRKLLSMEDEIEFTQEDLRAITTGCMISFRRAEPLVLMSAEKLFAKDWKSFKHPQFGLNLSQMYSKDQDKFLDSVVIPAITGSSNAVPKLVIKAALPDLKIGLDTVAFRWALQNGIAVETLQAFMDHNCPDGAGDGDWVTCMDSKLVKQIQAFAVATEQEEPEQEGTTSDW